MNFNQIEQLIRLIDSSDITELILEKEALRIELRKETAAPPGQILERVVEGCNDTQTGPVPPVTSAAQSGTGLIEVEAPMVGTFYRAPAPDAEPYVQIGDNVTKGQVLFIIEAMKMMNEIEAERDGVVRQILVENGEPVEYGQLLLLLEAAE